MGKQKNSDVQPSQVSNHILPEKEKLTLKLVSAWQGYPFHHDFRHPCPVFFDHAMTMPTVEHKALFFRGFSWLEEVYLVPGPQTFSLHQTQGSSLAATS